MSAMTPQEIVYELDKHIVGQNNAKKAVALALRKILDKRDLRPAKKHGNIPM